MGAGQLYRPMMGGSQPPKGASGTVTSVGLTMPAFIDVAGSPVTGGGTIACTLAMQSANTVFAGPASGAPAAPGFRAVVEDDIPALSASKITSGTISTDRLGAGVATAVTFLNGSQQWVSPVAGSNTQIQFNDSGAFGASNELTWNKTAKYLSIFANGTSPGLQISTAGASSSTLASWYDANTSSNNTALITAAGVDAGSSTLRVSANNQKVYAYLAASGVATWTAGVVGLNNPSVGDAATVGIAGDVHSDTLSTGILYALGLSRMKTTTGLSAGAGTGILFKMSAGTVQRPDAGDILIEWIDPSPATRTSRFRLRVMDSTAWKEGLRITPDGIGIGLTTDPTNAIHVDSGTGIPIRFDGAGATTAPGAAAGTLGNMPAGAAGNPDTFLTISIAGTTYVIPAWTP